MGSRHRSKKAAKMKAKNNKTTESTGINKNDIKNGSSTANSSNTEVKPVKDVAGSSQNAVDVATVQSSQPTRISELSQDTKENRVQDNPIAASNSEKANGCTREPITVIKVADSQSSSPNSTVNLQGETGSRKSMEEGNVSQEKMRDAVKAEREAKKAAKAAAKVKAKNKKTDETMDNVNTSIINEHPPTELKVSTKNTTGKSSQSTNVTVSLTQSPQPAKEAEKSSKESTIQQSPATQTINSNSVTISRQESTVSDEKTESKSKAELRAERRTKQEAQRAAKQSATKQQPVSTKQQSTSKSGTKDQEAPSAKSQTIVENASTKKVAKKDNDHEVNLFKHLYNERELALTNIPVNLNIHPAIRGLGAQYAGKTIVGSNARCLALLAAVKQVIEDFVTPEQADFTRSLEVCLRDLLAYLHRCRPVAVSMQNAMRHLKYHMTNFPVTMSTDEAKSKLMNIIDTYKEEQIILAGKAISITIQTKISHGDIILIYGFSSLIHNILVDAHKAGKKFRVIVVDGRPWLEGREQLRRLAKHGIDCSYMFINAVSFIMPEVSKVFLSAHAILANGAVMSRVGTSQIALIAKAFNVPVLVACETHKTCGRVQTDSIVHNELGNADDLVNSHQYSNSKKSLLTNWRARKSLNLLNITYDVTPADLITAVVTELAILPCTSIPVILRIKPSEF